MVLVLLGGCVHNVQHFATLVNKHTYNPYPRYYGSSTYEYSSRSNRSSAYTNQNRNNYYDDECMAEEE